MINEPQKTRLGGNLFVIESTDSLGRKHVATITALGSALIDYKVDGLAVVTGFDDANKDNFVDLWSGYSIFPWPNRLEDGKYTFDGVDYEVPINETDKNNQLHGLSPFYCFDEVHKSADSLTLGLRLPATLSYPFDIYTEMSYKLVPNGDTLRLHISAEAKNLGEKRAPWGFCLHPWFNIRGEYTASSLQVASKKYVDVTDRCLPIGNASVAEKSVSGTKFDLTNGRTFETSSDFDHAFIDVDFAEDNYTYATLTGADGHITTVAADTGYMSWQICTLQKENKDGLQNVVAIEPSTCYANVFKTGDNLIVLAPNETFNADCFIEFN